MQESKNRPTGGAIMDLLIVLGVIAVWIVLQIWVLPRFGVST